MKPADVANVLLPGKYAYGASMGPQVNVDEIITNSGFEQLNRNWADPLWNFSINYSTQRLVEIQNLENLYLQLGGPATSFLFDNLKDNLVDVSQGIANSDGTLKGHPYFRLFKSYFYDLTLSKYNRRLFKPKNDGNLKIYNNGTLVNWTVDYTNGLVALPLLSSKEITAMTKATNCVITCPAHGYVIGQKIFLNNILGMVEANYQVGTVMGVADANTFSIDLDTTNYSTFTYTANTSLAQRYINTTDVITWTGGFYTVVRFKENTLNTSYDSFNSLSATCTLLEKRLEEYNLLMIDD